MDKKIIKVVGVIGIIVLVFAGLFLTRNIGKSTKTISAEDTLKQLDKMYNKVSPTQVSLVKSPVNFIEKSDKDELPSLTSDSIVVAHSTPNYIEIVSSPEKAGEGSDGWLTNLVKSYNAEAPMVNGKPASIQLRNITSGLAFDYIRTGAYVPQAFTPSNYMWLNMLEAHNVKVDVVDDCMVGNTACIVINNKTLKEFEEKYKSLDLKSVIEATVAGDFIIGYTNPFTSSTGLNFLVSVLQRYSDDLLSDESVKGFTDFQSNIPFVAYNTIQMRDAADKGVLDCFILEMQTYNNDENLIKNYTAIPFGYRHDNPLAAIGDLDSDEAAILDSFASYCNTDVATQMATDMGFNSNDSYAYDYKELDGKTLIATQALYKESKDVGNTIVGVFVCDVSGSMEGLPIKQLKDSLLNSMQYISTDNYIGLVSYNNDVYINVPIDKFDLTQQSYFKGGVESLAASGATATYDGVVVAAKMAIDKAKEIPNSKPVVFVLSDGLNNRGYSLNDIATVIQNTGIPIYTISYNYTGDDYLSNLSELNEAVSIHAETDDVVYQIKNLLNASM